MAAGIHAAADIPRTQRVAVLTTEVAEGMNQRMEKICDLLEILLHLKVIVLRTARFILFLVSIATCLGRANHEYTTNGH